MYGCKLLTLCIFAVACNAKNPKSISNLDLYGILNGREIFLIETYSGILGEVQSGRDIPSSFLLRTDSSSLSIPALKYYKNNDSLITRNFDLTLVNQSLCGEPLDYITPCLQKKSDSLLSIFLETSVAKILSPTTNSGIIAFYDGNGQALVLITNNISSVILPYWKDKLKSGKKLSEQWYLVSM